MVAWHQAHRWAMVVLRPGEIPVIADPRLYLQAAADFEHGASPENARLASKARKVVLARELREQHMKPIAQFARAKLSGAPDFAALGVDASNAGRATTAQTCSNRLSASRPRAARSIDFASFSRPA
jgi:hypothetical protein